MFFSYFSMKTCGYSLEEHYQGSSNEYPQHIEGWAQDYSNSNIFLKLLFRGNLDPFINNANLGAIAHTPKFSLFTERSVVIWLTPVLRSTLDMFLCSNKKKVNTFGLKSVPYWELWPTGHVYDVGQVNL